MIPNNSTEQLIPSTERHPATVWERNKVKSTHHSVDSRHICNNRTLFSTSDQQRKHWALKSIHHFQHTVTPPNTECSAMLPSHTQSPFFRQRHFQFTSCQFPNHFELKYEQTHHDAAESPTPTLPSPPQSNQSSALERERKKSTPL